MTPRKRRRQPGSQRVRARPRNPVYRAELWDSADPEGEESFRPIYYTKGDIHQARNMYQNAAQHTAQLLSAN